MGVTWGRCVQKKGFLRIEIMIFKPNPRNFELLDPKPSTLNDLGPEKMGQQGLFFNQLLHSRSLSLGCSG